MKAKVRFRFHIILVLTIPGAASTATIRNLPRPLETRLTKLKSGDKLNPPRRLNHQRHHHFDEHTRPLPIVNIINHDAVNA